MFVVSHWQNVGISFAVNLIGTPINYPVKMANLDHHSFETKVQWSKISEE